jgi:hypothetical protein
MAGWIYISRAYAGSIRSITVDFYDSVPKLLRGFLRQIVPDAALDDPVRIFAREFLGVGTGVRVWPASICFSAPNDAFVPGLLVGGRAGFAVPACAAAEPNTPSWAAPMVMAAVPIKRRRGWLISADILFVLILQFPCFDRIVFSFESPG